MRRLVLACALAGLAGPFLPGCGGGGAAGPAPAADAKGNVKWKCVVCGMKMPASASPVPL
ncbi:MAG: hypothetical protein L0216_07925 [Planctomycetales bacterium]|nr:hypothetical protein [Planctomycetales bacterium]